MSIVPWSYTLLRTLDTCAHQTFRKYVLKDIKYIETEAQKKGNLAHHAFQRRMSEGICLPDDLDKYESMCDAVDWAIANTPGLRGDFELQLGMKEDGTGCDFFARDVWGRGKLDLVVRTDTTAVIYDYKTGKVREDPFELEVQALLLQANHPNLEVIKGRFIWLQENQFGKDYDLSDTIGTRKRVEHMMRIFADHAAKNDWPKNENPLCGWCDVIDCNYNKRHLHADRGRESQTGRQENTR